METKSRKVGRWIWLSKQNEIKIPKCSAHQAAPPHAAGCRPSPQAWAMTWRPRRNASFGRNQRNNFAQKFYSRGTLALTRISAIRDAFKSPMILNSLGRARKRPRVITAQWETIQPGKRTLEESLKSGRAIVSVFRVRWEICVTL